MDVWQEYFHFDNIFSKYKLQSLWWPEQETETPAESLIMGIHTHPPPQSISVSITAKGQLKGMRPVGMEETPHKINYLK